MPDESPNQAGGDRMVSLAMSLMQEVKADLGRMNDKLDDIARERRDEAREHGGLEVRVATLEASHKSTRWLLGTFAVGSAIGFCTWLFTLLLKLAKGGQ